MQLLGDMAPALRVSAPRVGAGAREGRTPRCRLRAPRALRGILHPRHRGRPWVKEDFRGGEACQSPPKAGQTGVGRLYRELGRGVRTSDLGQRMARVSQHPEGMRPRGWSRQQREAGGTRAGSHGRTPTKTRRTVTAGQLGLQSKNPIQSQFQLGRMRGGCKSDFKMSYNLAQRWKQNQA